ncbi:MAG: 30S ribosomal protein S6, partial [Chlamydiia bacterium]|nr:30S ribosomal protein S6 [Chlamydiia bacterium]
LYEGMYILSATLSDEARKKAFENIKNQIVEHGGEVVKEHEMGRKKLAYDINGHREGYYFLIYFNLDPAFVTELWREYHLNEDLVRFTTLRTEQVLEELKFKSLAEQS